VEEDNSFLLSVQTSPAAHPAFYFMVRADSFFGVNRQRLSLSAEVKSL
jgi:hypothetical protein